MREARERRRNKLFRGDVRCEGIPDLAPGLDPVLAWTPDIFALNSILEMGSSGVRQGCQGLVLVTHPSPDCPGPVTGGWPL